jgi:hypothetical protein
MLTTLRPALPVAVVVTLLAGCAAGSDGGAAASGAPAASSSDPRAAGCAVAPADLVGAALGDTLSPARQTRNGDTIVVCDYQGAKAGMVKLRIQTDSDAETFAADRNGFATQSMPTTEEDFVDEAFSSVLGSGSSQVTTLVARQGPVAILICAKATADQEKALLGQLFNRLRGS